MEELQLRNKQKGGVNEYIAYVNRHLYTKQGEYIKKYQHIMQPRKFVMLKRALYFKSVTALLFQPSF